MIWDRATVPSAAVDLIAALEGYRNAAYRDSVGYWTIAYGSRTMPDGSPVHSGNVVTLLQAHAMLARQCGAWVKAIVGQVRVPLTTAEAAALISYTHNFGGGVLVGNTMVSMLNGGEAVLASRQLGGWVLAAGQKELGLMRRRELERRVMLGGAVSEYDAVWRLSYADLLPAYNQAFVDAAAWHHAVVKQAPAPTADDLMAAEQARRSATKAPA